MQAMLSPMARPLSESSFRLSNRCTRPLDQIIDSPWQGDARWGKLGTRIPASTVTAVGTALICDSFVPDALKDCRTSSHCASGTSVETHSSLHPTATHAESTAVHRLCNFLMHWKSTQGRLLRRSEKARIWVQLSSEEYV